MSHMENRINIKFFSGIFLSHRVTKGDRGLVYLPCHNKECVPSHSAVNGGCPVNLAVPFHLFSSTFNLFKIRIIVLLSCLPACLCHSLEDNKKDHNA